ncbi:MAG: hypothetical protein V4677_05655 [Bacteroidota bacterium]
MRYYLFCIQLFLLVSVGFSQAAANKVYTVKKEKAANIKSPNEIIPDFPKKITWFSMEMIVNVGGKHGSKIFKGTDPSKINFSFLSQAKANSFVFVNLKCKIESGEVLYRRYKVKVVE